MNPRSPLYHFWTFLLTFGFLHNAISIPLLVFAEFNAAFYWQQILNNFENVFSTFFEGFGFCWICFATFWMSPIWLFRPGRVGIWIFQKYWSFFQSICSTEFQFDSGEWRRDDTFSGIIKIIHRFSFVSLSLSVSLFCPIFSPFSPPIWPFSSGQIALCSVSIDWPKWIAQKSLSDSPNTGRGVHCGKNERNFTKIIFMGK